jgi:hypothetical protein
MNKEERKELTALAVWLRTFPQVIDVFENRTGVDEASIDWLSSKKMAG